MNFKRFSIAITLLNLLLLFLIGFQTGTSAQSDIVPIIRARVIELVDDKGKTRAQFKIEETGEAVFRMRDQDGTIRTKMSAATDGSGLSMMDDRTEATIQLKAKTAGTSIAVYDRSGKISTIK